MRPRSPGGGANAASSLTSKITIGASKITIGVPPLAALPQAEMSSSTTAKYSRNSLSRTARPSPVDAIAIADSNPQAGMGMNATRDVTFPWLNNFAPW